MSSRSLIQKSKSTKKLEFPGKSRLNKSREASPQPPIQEGGGPQVDLSSTLSMFGHSGFDTAKYFNDHFAKQDISSIANHCNELVERKNVISRALKNYVTEHYNQFIHTSQELQCMFFRIQFYI